MPQQPVQATAGQPVEEDVSINIAGHKIKGRLIMKIAAIVAAACFFSQCSQFHVQGLMLEM